MIHFVIISSLINFINCLTTRVPLAENGIKGWITVDDAQVGTGVNFKFDLDGLKKGDIIKWAIYEIPLLIGQDKCWKLKESKPYVPIFAPLTITADGKVVETVIAKEISMHDLDGRSLALMKNDEIIACSNIILDTTIIFQSRFYGPEIAGSVYVLYSNDTKLLKLHSRIINANNFDLNLIWSLKKYWWLMDQDQTEPGTLSCKEKARTAYVWYTPTTDVENTVRPETMQMITISNDGGLTPTDLAKSVFVLEKINMSKWEKSPTVGCAKLKRIEPVSNVICVDSQSLNVVQLKQKSPFHPVQVFKNVTTPSLNCQRSKSTTFNSLPANQLINADGQLAFDVLAAQPMISRFDPQISAIARFVYPIVGEILFIQSKGNPDSSTVVNGWLQSLFDQKPLTNISMSIMKSYVGSDLDAMTCTKYKDLYNPSMINQDFCRKSSLTCPVGVVPYNFTVNSYNLSNSQKFPESFSFVTQNLPMDGVFSIIGQTVQINLPWGQACANITSYNSDIGVQNKSACDLKTDDILNQNVDKKMTSLVANFHPNQSSSFEGIAYLFQYPEQSTYPLQMRDTGMYFLSKNQTINMKDYIWEIVEITENQTSASAPIYNPFGVEMSSQFYSTACQSNPSLCAVGDVKLKIANSSEKAICIKNLPLSDYFSVENKFLRVRGITLNQSYNIAKLKLAQTADVIFRADSELTVSEIRNDIAQQADTDGALINVATVDTDKKLPPKCKSYRLSVFAPNALQFTTSLSDKMFNSTSLSKTLRFHECSQNGNKSFHSLRSINWSLIFFVGYLMKTFIL